MSRTDQRRRRVLRAVAPVAGLLAVGLLVWQGSYAAFSASTNNTPDSWATGSLTLLNDGGAGTGLPASYIGSTTALFTETAIKPLDTRTRCLTVKAGGTAGGTLKFYRGAITGTNSAALAPFLTMTVVAAPTSVPDLLVKADCTNFPAAGTTTIAAGVPLSTLPTTYGTGLGSAVIPAGTRFIAYKIIYTFSSTGSNPGDNALQSSDASAELDWEIQ